MSTIMIARVESLSSGPTTGTLSLGMSTLVGGILDALTIDVPVVDSAHDMNRNIRQALESAGILSGDDKLVLLGGAV